MKLQWLTLTLITIILIIITSSCGKELSFEAGSTGNSEAVGSLQKESSGDCLPKTIKGIFVASIALNPDSNFIEIQVDVTTPGNYQIATDVVGGISFSASGSFTSTGLNIVQLKGSGTPVDAGTKTFTVTFSGTDCTVDVEVLPEGGADPAVFDLLGSPDVCYAFVLSGAYASGAPLNSPSNNVAIKVTVNTTGTYNITTEVVNGISFSGSGVLSTLGNNTITLTATGTPGNAGQITIPITAGTTSCSFPLTVTGGSQYTINCTGATVEGEYIQGTPLDTGNTVKVEVNAIDTGAYSITGTANGMTFSGAGNFANTGVQIVTLTGSGTPAAEGDFSIPLTGGTAGCNVNVTVLAGIPTGDLKWEFKQDSIVFNGTSDGALIAVVGGVEAMTIGGESTGGTEALAIVISKTGGLTTGTYSTKDLSGNSVTLLDVANTSTLYEANPTSGDVTITITTLDRVNKIVEGTFSGTAKNAAGSLVEVSGSFKAQIL